MRSHLLLSYWHKLKTFSFNSNPIDLYMLSAGPSSSASITKLELPLSWIAKLISVCDIPFFLNSNVVLIFWNLAKSLSQNKPKSETISPSTKAPYQCPWPFWVRLKYVLNLFWIKGRYSSSLKSTLFKTWNSINFSHSLSEVIRLQSTSLFLNLSFYFYRSKS